MNNIKLLDMESGTWRNTILKPGDHWRSKLVYTCEICGSKTNHWWLFSPSWRAPKLYCPGNIAKTEVHQLLQDKISLLKNDSHPNLYREELKKEITEIRREFNDVPADVEMTGNNC